MSGSTARADLNCAPSTTLFFKPQARREASMTSWCSPASSPPGRQHAGHTLPQAPPAACRGASPGRGSAAVRRKGHHRARRRSEPAPGGRNVPPRARPRWGEQQARPGVRLWRRVHLPARGLARRPGVPVHLTPDPVPTASHRGRSRSATRSSRSPPAGRPGRLALRAKRWRSATAARSHAICPVWAGCPKACSAPAGGSNNPTCAPSPGPCPTAPMRSATKAKCGYGEAKPDCGNAIQRRRSTSAATCSVSPSIRATRLAATPSGRRDGVLLRYGKTLDRGNRTCPPQSQGAELHGDRLRRLGSDRRLPRQPQTDENNSSADCSSTTAPAGISTGAAGDVQWARRAVGDRGATRRGRRVSALPASTLRARRAGPHGSSPPRHAAHATGRLTVACSGRRDRCARSSPQAAVAGSTPASAHSPRRGSRRSKRRPAKPRRGRRRARCCARRPTAGATSATS